MPEVADESPARPPAGEGAPAGQPSRERVRATWQRAEDFEAFLTRWGLDGDDLRGLLYSRMVSERYIRRVAATHDTPAENEEFGPIYQAWIAEVRAKSPPRRAP